MDWWQELGYPPFEIGSDGFPRTGKVIKHYRKQTKDKKGKSLTQAALAGMLGFQDRRQVVYMENEDYPLDVERRQALCKLLNIPPVLLGIVTLEEIAEIIKQRVNQTGPIDIGEHRDFLTEAHNLHHMSTATLLLDLTQLRLNGLCVQFFGKGSNSLERKQIYELIFSYHILIGLQLRELQRYDEALEHITIAGEYADLLDSEELKTIHHLHYIRVFDAAGSIHEAVLSFDIDRLRKVSAPLASMGYAYVSTLHARAATTATDRKFAMTLLDYAEPFVHSHPALIDIHGLDCSLWGYYVRKARTQIGIGDPNGALDTLRWMEQPKPGTWGNAYQLLYEAGAHEKLGHLGVAVSHITECLKIAQRYHSPMNVARVQVLRDRVARRGYRGRDLELLDTMLLKG